MIMKIITSIFLLILLALFVANGTQTIGIINSIGGNINSFSKTIIGRK